MPQSVESTSNQKYVSTPLAVCLISSSTLMTEAILSFETSVNFYCIIIRQNSPNLLRAVCEPNNLKKAVAKLE
jgi:hypothetical protein